MNTLEGKAWSALAAAKGIGPRALWQAAEYLFVQQKTASWLLKNPERAREALRNVRGGIDLPDPDLLGSGAGEGAEQEGVHLLHPLHSAFPLWLRGLKEILPLPAILYAVGNTGLLKNPGVAIVGSRDAAREAIRIAEELAAELAGIGSNVVSGYAAGIDSAAHLGALRNQGTTTLVLAEGLDHFQVRPEFKGVLTDGNALVLSQFAPAAGWAAFQAMARNKLVVALAGAVVVVASGPERRSSGRMSGSFDAGLAALALGLPLFVAAPSLYTSPPEGNRELIARGGQAWTPAQGARSILAAMNSAAKKRVAGQKTLF